MPDSIISGIATSDVFGDDYYGDDHETNCDETVTAGINKLGHNSEALFYDEVRAQIDGGAKVSVTNLLTLLHKVKFYSTKFKCKIRMHVLRHLHSTTMEIDI
jgi:predicted DNA-binding ribbon-helix-helix protein